METSRLTVREKISCGMGDAGCNIIFGAIMLFVNYFYTDIFGLAPVLVGVLLLLARVIDAATDPIMGVTADRTRSKYGRFCPWLLWMAFPYALFSVLMLITPEWTYNSKVTYAFVTYFLLSITYIATNISYCSFGSIIINDLKERVACQSYRSMLVGIAILLLFFTLPPMTDWSGEEDRAKGYQMVVAVLAFIGMCMFLLRFTTVRERVRPAVQTNDDLKADLKDVWENDQRVRTLLLILCDVCPGSIRMAAAMYYMIRVTQQGIQFATLFISLGVIGTMISSMLAKVLIDRWCKLKVPFWTNIILAIFSAAFYFFDPKATMTIMALCLLLNILHQIPSPLHWSLVADVDDHGEWKTGKRIAGTSFSSNLFFLKLGLVIARAMVGFLFSRYGYDAGAKAQSDSVINGTMLLFTIIPGAGYPITAGVVRLLKVDREFMQQIQTDLEEYHANYRELNEYHDIETIGVVKKAQ